MAASVDMPNLTDRQLLEKIWVKMSMIDKLSEQMDSIVSKVTEFEKRLDCCEATIQDMQNGLGFIESDYEHFKADLNQMKDNFVSKDELISLKEEVIDLSNRSRRNNIVIHNVPEGEEGEDILGFVQDLVTKVIKVDTKIESAHRTASSKSTSRPITKSKDGPRLIHARCLRRDSRNEILLAAPKALKDHRFGEKGVYLTDDLHPETRHKHWLLHSKMKEMRAKKWLAFIPWSLPRVIRYKDTPKGTKGPLKTFRISDL